MFKKYHETGIFDENEIYPYITEGIGEDILPKNVDMYYYMQKAKGVYSTHISESPLFAGVLGLLQLKDELTEDDVVVVLFHDHGSRYVGKMFNDDWMRANDFLQED